ncbi:hypothetical protein C3Y87_04885 [Carbonactinospora thermoautotrophica]|nr:hypothetical protein [Carbonactinospora thermoautotrophica]
MGWSGGRRAFAHVVGETARHPGHPGILRELTGGAAGD